MSTFLVAAVVFWSLIAGLGWAKAYSLSKRTCTVQDLWEVHYGGYYNALLDEGYDKGEAVEKTMAYIRETNGHVGA